MNRAAAISYLPPFTNSKDITSRLGVGTNTRLVETILADYPKAVAQTRQLAQRFHTGSLDSTARAVWSFLKNQIRYREDSGLYQHIRLPNALVATGTGDCKSYAVFAAGIMANLGYPVVFRFAGYGGATKPGHVYILAGKPGEQKIIDAVWHRYNSEKKPYSFKQDFPMEIATISGLQCSQCRGIGCANCQGLGKFGDGLKKVVEKAKIAVKQAASSAKEIAQKGLQDPAGYLKTLALAAPRAAYLLLVKGNIHGFANKLDKVRNQALKKWESLGGMPGELNASINAGLTRKPIFGLVESYAQGPMNGIGAIGFVAESTAALITAAAPIIAAFAALLASIKGDPLPPGGDFGDGKGELPGKGQEEPPTKEGGSATTDFLNAATSIVNAFTGRGNTSGGSTTTTSTAPAPAEFSSNASNAAPAPSGMPGWLLPVGLGLGALLLLKK
jgi:hypothetical protein